METTYYTYYYQRLDLLYLFITAVISTAVCGSINFHYACNHCTSIMYDDIVIVIKEKRYYYYNDIFNYL